MTTRGICTKPIRNVWVLPLPSLPSGVVSCQNLYTFERHMSQIFGFQTAYWEPLPLPHRTTPHYKTVHDLPLLAPCGVGGAVVQLYGVRLAIKRSWVRSLVRAKLHNDSGQVAHTHFALTSTVVKPGTFYLFLARG